MRLSRKQFWDGVSGGEGSGQARLRAVAQLTSGGTSISAPASTDSIPVSRTTIYAGQMVILRIRKDSCPICAQWLVLRSCDAKGLAMTNTPTYDDLANIPQPAGATGMYEWCDPDQPLGVVATSIGPDTNRYFVGMSRTVSDDGEDIEVGIDGTHWADGRVQRNFLVRHFYGDDGITPAQACSVADALRAAAGDDLMPR